jgi:hypothetical protein
MTHTHSIHPDPSPAQTRTLYTNTHANCIAHTRRNDGAPTEGLREFVEQRLGNLPLITTVSWWGTCCGPQEADGSVWRLMDRFGALDLAGPRRPRDPVSATHLYGMVHSDSVLINVGGVCHSTDPHTVALPTACGGSLPDPRLAVATQPAPAEDVPAADCSAWGATSRQRWTCCTPLVSTAGVRRDSLQPPYSPQGWYCMTGSAMTV